jgi:hypothetical protein
MDDHPNEKKYRNLTVISEQMSHPVRKICLRSLVFKNSESRHISPVFLNLLRTRDANSNRNIRIMEWSEEFDLDNERSVLLFLSWNIILDIFRRLRLYAITVR